MSYVEEFELDVDKIECREYDSNECEMITFVGAGGKTTTMFKLAKELSALGKKVLVSTTTMIFVPQSSEYDHLFILEQKGQVPKIDVNAVSMPKGSITVIGSRISEEGKLIGVEGLLLNVLCNKKIFDFILVEGDGSKRRPIKAPADHEPVVPSLSSRVVGVIGMDAVGKEINEANVHRPELFCMITESKMGDVITFEHVFKLIESKLGIFKGTSSSSYKYVLMNKVQDNLDKEMITDLINRIKLLDKKIRNVIVNNYVNE